MTLQQLISQLKSDFASGYSRTKLLTYVERAQNELFNQDCAQTLFYNGSDDSFPIPILSTTEGTLKYTLSASNLVDSDGDAVSLTKNGYAIGIRRIARVFIDVSDIASDYNNIFYGRTFNWAGVDDNWSKRICNVRYQEVSAVFYDYTDAENAYLIFAKDPGTHTDRYYVEFYHFPISLDSESIPLTIDLNKWYEAIVKAARGYIEEARNGRSELLDGPANTGSFRRYWLPRFRNNMASGTEAKRPYIFATRECL